MVTALHSLPCEQTIQIYDFNNTGMIHLV